jgi:hypothetical protein
LKRKRRLNKHHIGRTRIRAANLIDKHFPDWKCQPEDISPAQGQNRSNWLMDVYRWELRVYQGKFVHLLGCWQTLTKFVQLAAKYGMQVDWKDREIHANEK